MSTITVISILGAAVTFTASLLWNAAIQSIIARWFPAQVMISGASTTKPSVGAIWAQFGFALVFTIVAVFALVGLSSLLTRSPHAKKFALV